MKKLKISRLKVQMFLLQISAHENGALWLHLLLVALFR